jgi:hypothetical protein
VVYQLALQEQLLVVAVVGLNLTKTLTTQPSLGLQAAAAVELGTQPVHSSRPLAQVLALF